MICICCGMDKEKDMFRDNRKKCKKCSNAISNTNRRYDSEKRKKEYIERKEIILKRQKEYREKRKEKDSTFIAKENERLLEYKKTEKGKENRKLSMNKYNNSEKRRIKAREWQKRKREDNISYRIGQNISHQIWNKIKSDKKRIPFIKFLDYSIEELMSHIEKQFTKNMSWENYGEWEIDHIIPSSLYDLKNKDNISKCWSLDNLRPLSKIDNNIKNDRLILEEIDNRKIWHLIPDELYLI